MNMKTNNLVAAWALLLSLPQLSTAADPDLPYESGSTGADGDLILAQSLPNRYDFAYAFDASRNETVLFSGHDLGEAGRRSAGFKPETWVFDGTQWAQRTHATFVSARSNVDMVYDVERQQIVMFGGQRADNVILGDTWIWDGTDWTEQTPASAPSPRRYHAMVWDAENDRVLLFGGQDASNPSVWFGDLWAWDGTTWTEIDTPETQADLRRQDYGDMVWDSANNRAVYYNDWSRRTFIFSGGTWTEVVTSQKPALGPDQRMVYDPVRDEVISTGRFRTWVFKNNEWELKTPANQILNRSSNQHGIVWDSQANHVLLFGGYGDHLGRNVFQDTRSWDGTTWTRILGRRFTVDMAEKADGVWNYEAITIPATVDVVFTKNEANSPVTWLATGEVKIDGRILLNGQTAPANNQTGAVARGGPGGFDGGIGGIRFDVSGSYTGTAGQGPGGTPSPTEPSQSATYGNYNGVYGNTLIQPLIGGSGGGGGSSSATANGGNGGGGGGAILIATSRDIELNGLVLATGGGRGSGAGLGGGGSGGAVRLVADRLVGSGSIDARGGNNRTGTNNGRVRLEAFFRPLAANVTTPVPSATAPVEAIDLTDQPDLRVISVAGNNVADPPTGSLNSPDVVFTAAGEITVTVEGDNIPPGTPVTLRITTSEGIINLPASNAASVTLSAGGTASFTTMVPAGLGTIQAFAEFTLSE